jgi:Ni,Fe-hydrogenase III large subunit
MSERDRIGELLAGCATVPGHGPWPRYVVDTGTWQRIGETLAAGHATLLGLWGDAPFVHAALANGDGACPLVASLECAGGRFPSLGRLHAAAIRPERAVQDLYGLAAEGLPDARPWLDHGRWTMSHPLGARGATAPVNYAFLPVEGESLHQIPVGPVHAGIIEPGHFRFTANGETVARLEQRLGYVHKGVESLLAGATLERAAQLAARVSGDSTVAYGLAFAQAVEVATGAVAPPRAAWLRAVMAELERLANHFGDVGAICNDAAFGLMHNHCAVFREELLRAANECFGHRLMMDRVVPGGVSRDVDRAGRERLRALLSRIEREFPELIELYDNTASLQDRTVGTGVVAPELVRRFAAGGYVGRASGRDFDARRTPGYAPYGDLRFEVPVLEAGDVDARVWIRIREIEQSVSLLGQMLAHLPPGPIFTTLPAPPAEGAEGVALVEGFRGDILAWVRLHADATVARCHLRDPSWFQWPLLEVAIEGNIVADFPLCNKSFNCSYSGHDL